ncbi:MAG: DNA polymerase III subunit delta' [Maricaulaceae bacterium]
MRTIEAETFPEADRVHGCPHPRETYNLLGHEKAEAIFTSAMTGDRPHHAWLITGVKGVGKATLSYRMARYLLGASQLLQDGLDFSSDDPVVQRIASQGHGNLFVLRRPYDIKTKKIRTEIPVTEARKLRDFLIQKPSETGWRVVIIDSMDEMNRNAENAILKSLEEPPEKTMFFLLSSTPGRLLPTIRSRCVSLSLRAVEPKQIQSWVRNRDDYSDEIRDAAVKLSRGGPGRAYALCESADQVLIPLSRYISSLTRTFDRVDIKISQSLSRVDQRKNRHLFWETLGDMLDAQARFVSTNDWQAAFKPFPTAKPAQTWVKLSERVRQLAVQSDALNMDHTSVMMTALNEIRTA